MANVQPTVHRTDRYAGQKMFSEASRNFNNASNQFASSLAQIRNEKRQQFQKLLDEMSIRGENGQIDFAATASLSPAHEEAIKDLYSMDHGEDETADFMKSLRSRGYDSPEGAAQAAQYHYLQGNIDYAQKLADAGGTSVEAIEASFVPQEGGNEQQRSDQVPPQPSPGPQQPSWQPQPPAQRTQTRPENTVSPPVDNPYSSASGPNMGTGGEIFSRMRQGYSNEEAMENRAKSREETSEGLDFNLSDPNIKATASERIPKEEEQQPPKGTMDTSLLRNAQREENAKKIQVQSDTSGKEFTNSIVEEKVSRNANYRENPVNAEEAITNYKVVEDSNELSKEEKEAAITELNRKKPGYSILVTNEKGDQLKYSYQELVNKGWTESDFEIVERGDALSNLDDMSDKAHRMFVKQAKEKGEYATKYLKTKGQKKITQFLNRYYRGDNEPPPEVHRALAPLYSTMDDMSPDDQKKMVEAQLLQLELEDRKRAMQELGVNMTSKELRNMSLEEADLNIDYAKLGMEQTKMRMSAINDLAQADAKFFNSMKTAMETLNSVTEENIFESGGVFRSALEKIEKKNPEAYNGIVLPVLQQAMNMAGVVNVKTENDGGKEKEEFKKLLQSRPEMMSQTLAAISGLPAFKDTSSETDSEEESFIDEKSASIWWDE